ncbi:MAG: hypothetical protein JXA44_01415 [Methanospirillaceae archaeon]|nr:hypothetical protein [Methanospirillaceae archaeon]
MEHQEYYCYDYYLKCFIVPFWSGNGKMISRWIIVQTIQSGIIRAHPVKKCGKRLKNRDLHWMGSMINFNCISPTSLKNTGTKKIAY